MAVLRETVAVLSEVVSGFLCESAFFYAMFRAHLNPETCSKQKDKRAKPKYFHTNVMLSRTLVSMKTEKPSFFHLAQC